jgi:hypothetical protein
MEQDDVLNLTVHPNQQPLGRGASPRHQVYVGKSLLGTWSRPWTELPLRLHQDGVPLDRIIAMRWPDATTTTLYTTLARAIGLTEGPGTEWRSWYRELPGKEEDSDQ